MNRKKYQYKIRENDPENGICKCKVNGDIDAICFEKVGVCPSLKIIAIFEGYKVTTEIRDLMPGFLSVKRLTGNLKTV